MHNQVMGFPKEFVDHRDHDGLNNQKSNLRKCTQSENQANSRRRIDNGSGFKGVCRFRNKWQAQISVDGKLKYLGLYQVPELAAIAYDSAAVEHYGQFALTNKMLGLL